MENFDFNELNIFLRISFFNSEENIFIYSNKNGINHLTEELKNSNFDGIFTKEEILKKLTILLTNELHYNAFTGVDSSEWISVKIMIDNEKEGNILSKKWNEWLEKAQALLGKENLFIVEIDKKIVRSYINDNQKALLECLESKRMSTKLENDLINKENTVKKIKI